MEKIVYSKEENADLVFTLKTERKKNIRSGIYGFTQRELAYNSNKIEGSTLSQKHTLALFETGQIYTEKNEVYKPKDVEEMQGHFAMFNYMLDTLQEPINESIIKGLHKKLKQCVFEDIANGYNIGEYKGRRNFVGDIATALPSEVPDKIKELLEWYHSQNVTLEILAEFHARYESIHPFQDGNGRTGRIILFRECLFHSICPFILRDENRAIYINALNKGQTENQFTELVALFEKEQCRYKEQLKDSLMCADN